MQGQTPALFIGEERAAQINRLLQEQGSFLGEVTCRTREGKLVPVEVSVSPLRTESRGACCYVGFARDISQRKRQEARRRVVQQMREAVLKMQGVDDIEEDISLFQELAEGLSEAFRRCDDLQQLALSQESYRTLVETPDFIVILMTTNGHYTYVSPHW